MPLANLVQWMGLPELASEHGAMIDHMLNAVHWFMLILFIGWTAFFFYVLWRFRRRRNPKADYHGIKSHFSTHLEIGVVIVEVLLLIGFAFPLWAQRVNDFPLDEGNPVVVRATGWQFGWTFHYPGSDMQFGPRSEKMLTGGAGDIGLDWRDETARDDVIVQRTVTLPVNQPAIIQLSSLDVIHNLALPNMRIAQDAIPGSEIPMWFTPTKTGQFDIVCGQLCGSGHYAMQGVVEVLDGGEYADWIKQQSETALKQNNAKYEKALEEGTLPVDEEEKKIDEAGHATGQEGEHGTDHH